MDACCGTQASRDKIPIIIGMVQSVVIGGVLAAIYSGLDYSQKVDSIKGSQGKNSET